MMLKEHVIVDDKDSDLAFAKRGTKWKCENGFHHKRAIKEIMKEQAANGVNTEPTDRNGTVSLRPSETLLPPDIPAISAALTPAFIVSAHIRRLSAANLHQISLTRAFATLTFIRASRQAC
jgi:hypothetical protein